MGKIWVEVCLISARGLRRTASLFKLQWFAVGWIDPDNKYCTTIDASGSGNPIWKTKFSVAVDAAELNSQDPALYVEVHSREPIFLRSSLLGTATIVLKEFLDKYNANSDVSEPVKEVGSFQLRKKSSNKSQGLVDVSIRISSEREEPSSSYPAGGDGFNLADFNGGINLNSRYGSVQPQRHHPTLATTQQPERTNCKPISNAQEEFSPAINDGGIKLVNRYESEHTQRPHQSYSTSYPEPDPSEEEYNPAIHSGGIKLVNRHALEHTQRHQIHSTSYAEHDPSAEEEFNSAIHSGGIKLVNRYATEHTQRPHQNHSTSYSKPNPSAEQELNTSVHGGGIKLVNRYGPGGHTEIPHSTSQQPYLDDPMPAPQNNSHGRIKLVSRYGSGDSQRPRQTLTKSQQPTPNNPVVTPPSYSQHHSSPGPSYSQSPHQTLTTSRHSTPNSPMSIPPNYSQYHSTAGPSYEPSRTPPPPPPPSNVGYISNYFPHTDHYGNSSYINMPHSGGPPSGRGARPGFGMGLGAGALAAGAMIFGDDFLSGFDVLGGQRDPSVTISANPPF